MKSFLKLFLIGFFLSFSSYGQITGYSLTASTTSNCANGTITVHLSGGTAPYRFIINDHNYSYDNTSTSTDLTLTNVPTGSYYIYAIDANNIWTGAMAVISTTFSATENAHAETCNNNGSLEVIPNGGVTPYTYLWSNGATTKEVLNLNSGIYYVSVTDNNGCVYNSDSLYVGQNFGFSAYTNSSDYTCQSKGSSTVVTNGIGSPFTYYWKTSPVQTTQTAINLDPGEYEAVVTSSNGCSSTITAYINRANDFNITMTSTNADCNQNNGSIAALANGGASPYSYLWNNGATTSNLTSLPGETNYSLTATDAQGCQSVTYAYVGKKSPLQLTFSNTEAPCFATGGTATVAVTNGLAPYTYVWSNGANTNSITNLTSGYYSALVEDANGCQSYGYTYIPQNNCYSTISGTVYNDLNNNCIQDAGELGSPSAMIKYGTYSYTYTDSYGNYEIEVIPGNHTLDVIPKEYWTTGCASNSITVNASATGSNYTNNNFYITPNNEIHDVSVYLYANPQRPGFTRSAYIYYYNNGTTTESGSIEYVFSNDWDYSDALPQPDYYDPLTRKATWQYSGLQPSQNGFINISMNVPITVVINTLLTANVIIRTVNVDANDEDNIADFRTLTIGSFDPNDIQVSPQGTTPEGYITSEQEALTYQIRFQNTGNDVAYNVVVKNPIDENLEDYTLTIIGSSHDCKASISNHQLTFDFKDINLADSIHNEKDSHGYVLYRVNRKSDLAPLTQIFNKADIYFDYNAPVETNEVKNTIASVTPNVSELESQDDLVFYPNPCRDHIQLSINIKEVSDLSVQLYSSSGQQVSVIDNMSMVQGLQVIDLNLEPFNLPAGLYVAKVVMKDKVYTKSILINK